MLETYFGADRTYPDGQLPCHVRTLHRADKQASEPITITQSAKNSSDTVITIQWTGL